MALAALLILVASLSLVVASHVGFEHMACRMAEDALASALNHSRILVKRIEGSVDEQERDVASTLRENADWLRGQLRAMVEDEPTVLYGMSLSKEGDILVHTEEELEGTRVRQEGEVSPLSASVREFPRDRLGYEEPIYEVRTPIGTEDTDTHVLVLGLSKAQIDQHIAEVRRGVRVRMVATAGIGLAILVVPGIGLWLVLKRYRDLEARAQELGHLAQMGRMSAGLVHEIRNPLNAIRFNLKIMEEDTDRFPDEIREGHRQIIDRAAGETGRLQDLLTEFLSYVRPGHRTKDWHDLDAIVEAVLGFLEYECRRYDIKIERNLRAGRVSKVFGDERRLKQAVLNVVLNARQALRPTGGDIRVTSDVRDGVIVLEIADDGPGIPEDELARIFEPFHSTREEGAGLGLAIARRVVKDHGGTIECRSKSGHGSTFIMTFPRHHRPSV